MNAPLGFPNMKGENQVFSRQLCLDQLSCQQVRPGVRNIEKDAELLKIVLCNINNTYDKNFGFWIGFLKNDC